MEKSMNPIAKDCASEVLDVVPSAMRMIRNELRSHRGSDMSVPQFRALLHINRNPGASLNSLAEHLGLTPPSTSKLVNDLVERGLVDREESSSDRRRITMNLTDPGKALLERSYQATQQRLIELFSGLSETECQAILEGMQVLRPIFSAIHTTKDSEPVP
jgi:DNA-binding MarR family transcriptional regulator